MWRTLILASTTYALGHPAADGIRPAALELPITAYYLTVNEAVHDARGKLDLAIEQVGAKPWIAHLERVADAVSHVREGKPDKAR